jgi:uncharacterized protein (DUF1330 family)
MVKVIKVLAAANLDELENDGAAIVMEFDTVKEAKKHAQYYTSEAFRVVSEASQRLGYSRVTVNGECVYDHFGF